MWPCTEYQIGRFSLTADEFFMKSWWPVSNQLRYGTFQFLSRPVFRSRLKTSFRYLIRNWMFSCWNGLDLLRLYEIPGSIKNWNVSNRLSNHNSFHLPIIRITQLFGTFQFLSHPVFWSRLKTSFRWLIKNWMLNCWNGFDFLPLWNSWVNQKLECAIY